MDRMLGYSSGMVGFPLRLLARENYDKLVARLGPGPGRADHRRGKNHPANARYFCCTVEAMPLERQWIVWWWMKFSSVPTANADIFSQTGCCMPGGVMKHCF